MPVCPVCSLAIPAVPCCPACGAATELEAPFPTSSRAGERSPPLSQDELWSAVIGPRRSAHYLRRFARLSLPGASRFGWHWPAFFVPPYWFLYRRMWGWAAIYTLALPLFFLADGLIAAATGPFRIVLDAFTLLALSGAGLVLPALVADRLYLAHCNRLIRRTRRGGARHRHLARLAARGGTSEAAATGAAVFSGVVLLAVVGGLGLALGVDYGKREKVLEALRIGAPARAAVAGFVDRRGTIPASWQEMGFRLPPLPAHVSKVDLDPRTGTIVIDTQVSKAEAGAIRLVPQLDERERIVWMCRADPAIEPFSPRSCRSSD